MGLLDHKRRNAYHASYPPWDKLNKLNNLNNLKTDKTFLGVYIGIYIFV